MQNREQPTPISASRRKDIINLKTQQLVDDIFIQAMQAENKRLDYLKSDFRTSPTAFNPNEMSVAKLFKSKQEKELKMNLKLKLMQKSDPSKKIEGLTPQ